MTNQWDFVSSDVDEFPAYSVGDTTNSDEPDKGVPRMLIDEHSVAWDEDDDGADANVHVDLGVRRIQNWDDVEHSLDCRNKTQSFLDFLLHIAS